MQSVTSEVILSFEDNNDKRFVLLINAPGPSTSIWQLPKTQVRDEETTLDAAQRVVMEKINLNLDKSGFEFLNIFDDPKRVPRERTFAAAYFHFIDEVNSILVARNSILRGARRKWFEVDKLPKLLFDHEKMIQEFLRQQYPVQYSFDK